MSVTLEALVQRGGKWHQTVTLELSLLDAQDSNLQIDIGDSQPACFPSAQSTAVEYPQQLGDHSVAQRRACLRM